MRFLRLILIVCTLGIASSSWAAEDVSKGKNLYGQYCAQCHGFDAKGNGAATSSVSTEPADLTRIAERREGVWPILEVE